MGNSEIFAKIGQASNILPEWLRTSPIQTISNKSFQFGNLLLQSLFFSKAVLSLITCLSLLFGITWISSVINNKPIYVFIAILFTTLNLFNFSDNFQLIHECIKLMSGFYVALYAVEGCVYAKDYIEGEKLRSSLIAKKTSQQTYEKILRKRNTLKDLVLMSLTLLSTFFLIFIWYQTRISKFLPSLADNDRILISLIVSTALLYLTSIIKKTSLFLPALVCFLIIYSTVFIRILTQLLIYPEFSQLKHLHLPLQSISVVILAVEGKYKHSQQEAQSTAEQAIFGDEIKIKRMQIESMFWTATSYYLYTVTHGYDVNMQYLVVPVFMWLVVKNYIK